MASHLGITRCLQTPEINRWHIHTRAALVVQATSRQLQLARRIDFQRITRGSIGSIGVCRCPARAACRTACTAHSRGRRTGRHTTSSPPDICSQQTPPRRPGPDRSARPRPRPRPRPQWAAAKNSPPGPAAVLVADSPTTESLWVGLLIDDTTHEKHEKMQEAKAGIYPVSMGRKLI